MCRGLLEQDLGGRLGGAALEDELDGSVQVGFARGDALGEMERVTGLDEDVQAPALHLRPLVVLGQLLGHGAVSFVLSWTNPARKSLLGESADALSAYGARRVPTGGLGPAR